MNARTREIIVACLTVGMLFPMTTTARAADDAEEALPITLPADVRAGVRRVVADEAGRFVDAVPPHGMKRDTKAEENAWNSRIFSAAVLLMPKDARRNAWEQA
jgi:hypothetical protein